MKKLVVVSLVLLFVCMVLSSCHEQLDFGCDHDRGHGHWQQPRIQFYGDTRPIVPAKPRWSRFGCYVRAFGKYRRNFGSSAGRNRRQLRPPLGILYSSRLIDHSADHLPHRTESVKQIIKGMG